MLRAGDLLASAGGAAFQPPDWMASRGVAWDERRNYNAPPPLRVWPGAQWQQLSDPERVHFFATTWTVSPQSDRVGYRLSGPPLGVSLPPLLSEPAGLGVIQLPPDGEPLVLMRDGPTVGGYPKIGVLAAEDLDWLAQCRPGQAVRFRPAN